MPHRHQWLHSVGFSDRQPDPNYSHVCSHQMVLESTSLIYLSGEMPYHGNVGVGRSSHQAEHPGYVMTMACVSSTSPTLRQGLDWHGLSTAEVWHCTDALEKLLQDEDLPWTSWSIPSNTQVVLIGHSNGGQGTWHIAERFPDRVAAGKLSSQPPSKGPTRHL